MKEITIKLYDYEELSKEAQEKALKEWNEHNDDPFMQSHMINLLKEKLDDHGIEYDEDSIDVRYSLSYCQGDGFMFIGKVEWCGETITITHNDPRYYHKQTARFDYDDTLSDKDAEAFEIVYDKICDEMERVGYDEIAYAQSEEAFREACDANGYTFTSNGQRLDADAH